MKKMLLLFVLLTASVIAVAQGPSGTPITYPGSDPTGVTCTSTFALYQGQLFICSSGVYTRMPTSTTGNSYNNLFPVQTATVTLSAAQIKNLVAAPVNFIPAPGAGKMIVPFTVGVTVGKTGSHFYGDPLPNFGANVSLAYDTSDLLPAVINGTQDVAGYDQILTGNGTWSGYTTVPHYEFAIVGFPGTVISWPQQDTTFINKAIRIRNVTVAPNNFTAGQVLTTSLNAGGSGYAIGDTGTIDSVNFGSQEYVVDTVNGGGAVLTYHLGSAGNTLTYVPVTGATTTAGGAQAGIGTGFKVNILTVQQGDLDLSIVFQYSIMTLP